ncbi:MAG: hypothetical protein Q8P73_05520 [bacterium]|nr:hypothetical protein [bacterium]
MMVYQPKTTVDTSIIIPVNTADNLPEEKSPSQNHPQSKPHARSVFALNQLDIEIQMAPLESRVALKQ